MVGAKLVNPFKPTAGAEPPVLIGRDKVIDDFSDSLDEGVGAPARLMRITGPRGSGKTVLLTELGDIARKRGWTVVDETAGENLCSNMVAALARDSSGASISADFDMGVVKVHAGAKKEEGSSLREALKKATEKLGGNPVGLLVTVDEVQDAKESDMRDLAAAVQHLIREKRNIAFVFAGITTGVMDLVSGQALTFLRRAKAEELDSIPLDEVSCALRSTIEKSGMSIEDEALAKATEATAGYAYLIQLVGYHVWRMGKRHAQQSKEIDVGDVEFGVKEAMRDFNTTVHEPALAGLPLHAMEYVIAMSQDAGVSRTSAVAERIGVAPSSLTSYRRLLINRQIVESAARGFVAFSIPYMREYVRANREDLLARYGV